jgi:hypothetical protein
LRKVLWTKGERIVNLVGNLILKWVHHFAPNFLFAQIFERFGNDAAARSAEENSEVAIAKVVA